MKKLLNKLSNSGRMELDGGAGEERLDMHVKKTTTLPADTRDTSQDIKIKKSFSSSGSIGRSSGGIKHQKDKEAKEKLNESDDKSLRKSGSQKKKSSEVKNPDSMRSPSLKSIFSSSYEQQRDTGLIESSDSEEEDNVPRSRGNSMHDDELLEIHTRSTTPVRVPSAPVRLAVSPVPAYSTPPRSNPASRAASPRMDSPPSSAFSTYSPPRSPLYTGAASPVPNLPRSVSSPNPAISNQRSVIDADEFDRRFANPVLHSEAVSDETALGADFSHSRTESVSEDVDMDDYQGGELMNQRSKSGLFSFGNKPKKLK